MNLRVVIFFLILAVGSFLRFYKLVEVPPALNWDEVSHGYNAYSILLTGRDQWGQFLPLTNFRAYGDYPLPLYMYLSMPLIIFLGLNELSIRLVSALFGVLLIPVVYYLTKKIISNEYLSLLAAFLVAVSPWSILTSRQVLQATPAIFFMTAGVTLFLRGVKESKIWIVLATFLIGISAYAYHNTRILAGPILILLFLIFWNTLNKNKRILSTGLITGAILLLPLVPIIFSSGGSARARWVGIVDQGALNSINEARGSSSLPQFLNVAINNRYTYAAKVFITNYLGYFSPQFLGFMGGTNLQFSVPGFGLVYPYQLPFFYLGLTFLIIRFKRLEKEKKILLLWMILAPIPAAMTRDPYQVVRSTVALPLVHTISVLGIYIIVKLFRRYQNAVLSLLFILGIATLIHLTFYFSSLINVYPVKSSFAWQYGYKQATDYVKDNGDEYSKIIFTKKYGEPHEFVLFYLLYDPKTYQQDTTAIRYNAHDWFWVDKLGKYEFINDEDILEKTSDEDNALLITSPGNYPAKGEILEKINFLDGKAAFDIVKL